MWYYKALVCTHDLLTVPYEDLWMQATQWMVDHQIMTLITSALVAHPSCWGKKWWRMPRECAAHDNFNIFMASNMGIYIICSDCCSPVSMSRAQAESRMCCFFVFFLHIRYVIGGPLLGKYQHCIAKGSVGVLSLGWCEHLCREFRMIA